MIDENGNRNGIPQIPGDSPAFPVSLEGCGNNGWHGMSLRDWFAGQVIGAVVTATAKGQHRPKGDGSISELMARDAYALADAMIAIREGKS